MGGLELDYHTPVWFWLEQAMLVIYFFELAVRLKRWGCKFWIHPDDWTWNNLDFIIVSGGVVEQWMMPIKDFVQSFFGSTKVKKGSGSLLSLLRMMRLLR